MTFDELKDQVFALIDRELVDPSGVYEILATLPAGREYFERMKGALALAEQLPRVEPPAHVNGMLLALAAEQASTT